MRRERQSGFVLVIVLGVLVLLTVLTLGFARRALLERRAAFLSLQHTVAMSYARGAAQRGIADLRNRTVLEGLGNMNGPGRGATWRTHSDPFSEKLFDKSDFDESDKVDYIVEDLDGHISMNLAPEDLLAEVKFLKFSTVGKIIERRHGEGGIRPKTPFLVTEEVLTLGDLDDEQWLGSEDEPGVRTLLSAWGDKLINVNSAPAEVLSSIPGMDRTAVEDIVSYRNGPDGELGTDDDKFFANFEALGQQCGISGSELTELMRYCKLKSRFFTITGLATRLQGKVKAYCEATVEIRGEELVVLQWREGSFGS